MPDINFHRQGEGEPLVLIHGIGSRWQIWLPVLGQLARERDVIALDLPGFGFSPRPTEGVHAGPSTLARLLGEFLEDLELERPHLAGNSLGGWVGLELAKRGRAASVTALSPAGFHTQAEGIFQFVSLALSRKVARLARPNAARLAASPSVRRIAFAQLVAHPERIDAFDLAENLRALADAEWFDETLDAIIRERFFGREPIDVPVTIAWGEHDRLLLPRQAHLAARQLPRAQMVVMRGCGHVPTYDDPEQVAAVLLKGSGG